MNRVYITIWHEKYGKIQICHDDNQYIINSSRVMKALRKRGIGTELIKSAEDIIKKLGGDCAYLFVLGKNEWVHNWYKRLGYTDTDVECEDGYLKMKKKL